MKILFLDTVHPLLMQRLTAIGMECEEDYTSTKPVIEEKIHLYDGLVIRSRIPIDSNFIDKAVRLKFIARSGAGLENIDTDYCKIKSIQVFNSPEGNMDAVGEHAVGMLLMLFNHLKKGDKEVRQGIWDREGNRGIELKGKTVGIIGYGNMGSAFAKKLSGFEINILAYDKYKKGFGNEYVKETTLDEIYSNTDVLSIHLPLSDETHHYVNQSFINKFKKPFYLINTARGNHIKTIDLIEALNTKKILGACLDVLEFETKSFELNSSDKALFNQLTAFDNVLFSPHVAGWTVESYEKLAFFLAEKIENWYQNFCK
ncbi:MAG: 2-hydroxyacid dehydrogenase [Vicingaceae bacterium]